MDMRAAVLDVTDKGPDTTPCTTIEARMAKRPSPIAIHLFEFGVVLAIGG